MIASHELFSLLSDETRLRCLVLLHLEKELCVCELSHTLDSIQPKISRHLALLRKSRLVLNERREQWVFYRLNNDLETQTKKILAKVLHELKTSEPFHSDHAKLIEFRKNCSC